MIAAQRDEQRALTRRSLIKWTLASAAAFGIPRWKAFEILEHGGGKALAAEAACHPSNRSVHIIGGSGGFAWFNLLWPHNEVAASGNPDFAFHAYGQTTMAAGTDKPLTLGPQAPWKSRPGNLQITALMGGRNEAHTNQPTTNTSIAGGTSVFAAVASIQSTNPSLVPVITVDDVPFGVAGGAPADARVGASRDIVGLFNSAASRAGGVLEDTADAELFSINYNTLIALNKVSKQKTADAGISVGKKAAALIGTNLADKLAVSDVELARYGITGGSRGNLKDLALGLAITAKAFALGLTSSVVLPAMRDDPHGAFQDMTGLQTTITTLGTMLDAFMEDCLAFEDSACPGAKVSDSLVMSIHGDTPKNPLQNDDWSDGTPKNSNWVFAYGNGLLKTGWFGQVKANGDTATFDPETGDDNFDESTESRSASAAAAVAYAVANGDMRRVADFYRGPALTGIVNLVQM
jgi:hypothetical protein